MSDSVTSRTPSSHAPAVRQVGAWIFALVLFSLGYFAQGGGPSQNSRFDLTRAIVVRDTFAIDAYHRNTIDRSFRDGHHYSDKAPGLSFAAVPVHAAHRAWQRLHGVRETHVRPGHFAGLRVVTFFTVSLVAALGAAAFFAWLLRLGVHPAAATVSTLAWMLGSHAFAYGAIFTAHQFTAALLVIALWAADRPPGVGRGVTRWGMALAGFALGLAVIAEFPSAPLAAAVALWITWRAGWRAVGPALLAALPPLAIAGLYHHVCFGAPWRIGYGSVADASFRAGMSRGFHGVGVPDPRVMAALLFGEYRGWLPLSPFLALAAPGVMRARRSAPALLALCGLALAWALSLASGYWLWSGGAAMGPRHMTAALPFAVTLVAFALDAWIRDAPVRAWVRPLRLAFAAVTVALSVAVCTVSVAVMPEFPDVDRTGVVVPGVDPDMRRPVREFALPLFVRGVVSLKSVADDGTIGFACDRAGHDDDAYNLGEALGLRGVASLAPLWAVWALGLAAIVRALRARGREDRAASA